MHMLAPKIILIKYYIPTIYMHNLKQFGALFFLIKTDKFWLNIGT
jgi:hypothetical protein